MLQSMKWRLLDLGIAATVGAPARLCFVARCKHPAALARCWIAVNAQHLFLPLITLLRSAEKLKMAGLDSVGLVPTRTGCCLTRAPRIPVHLRKS